MAAVHAIVALILAQDPAERLRDEDAAVRVKARADLVAAGEASVEPLCRILLDQYPDLLARAESLLAEIGAEDVEVRERSTEALIQIGPRVEALLAERAAALAGEEKLRLNRVLAVVRQNAPQEKVASARQKASACMVLGELRDARAVEALTAMLAHADFEVRSRAVLALGRIGDPRAAADAAALLSTEADFRMRSYAAMALGRIGGEEAHRALRERLVSGAEVNEQVARRIMDGLAADPSAEAAKLLIERMESPSATIRHAAGRLARARAAMPEAPFHAHRPDDEENARTLAALREWWEKAYGRAWE